MKAVYALIGASVLMIVAGIALIVVQEPAPEEPPPQAQERDLGVIPAPAEEEGEEVPTPEIDAEPGSDTWCEKMMNRSNASWSKEQSQTFADHCIYQNSQEK